MKKWLIRILILLLLLPLLGLGYIYFKMKDRHPGYEVDLLIQNDTPAPIQAGFAKVSITPEVPDRWTDANGDAQYNPEDGDTFEDGNGNGRFDPVWIAGFQNKRPANGIHDELWSRAMVLDDGKTRIAVAVLDLIGYGADDVISVRKLIPESIGIDYVIISSTHTHEGPDLIGLWGASEFKSGVDQTYRKWVQEQAAASIIEAAKKLKPAELRFAEDLVAAQDLVMDTRPPYQVESEIRLMQAVDVSTGATLGTLFGWSNHPETLWDKNLLLTSDFPHYVREGMENGITFGDSTLIDGLGGVCIYINGSIGGLMTTAPSLGIPDLVMDTTYLEPSFDKARAQGERLARLGLWVLKDTSSVTRLRQSAIHLRAKTFEMPLANPLYRLAAVLGVLDRGTSSWMKIRSEVCYWRIGPAGFLHQPGEIYPEIVNGGVEAPEGQDFAIGPVETPPLREIMNDQHEFVLGLSNDMIGYIIPKSQWDAEAPFTYEEKDGHYGEINSVGPETGPIIYEQLKSVLLDLQQVPK